MAQKPVESIIEMDELNKAIESIKFEILDPALKISFNLFLNKSTRQEKFVFPVKIKERLAVARSEIP